MTKGHTRPGRALGRRWEGPRAWERGSRPGPLQRVRTPLCASPLSRSVAGGASELRAAVSQTTVPKAVGKAPPSRAPAPNLNLNLRGLTTPCRCPEQGPGRGGGVCGVPMSRPVLLSTQEHWCPRPQEPSEKPRTQREARAHPTSHRLAVSAWPPCTYPKLLHVPWPAHQGSRSSGGPGSGDLGHCSPFPLGPHPPRTRVTGSLSHGSLSPLLQPPLPDALGKLCTEGDELPVPRNVQASLTQRC